MSSSFSQLPMTVRAVAGETATSLASRLAHLNGVPRLVAFCSDLGISRSGLTNGRPQEVRDVAALAGQDPEPLLFWTPHHAEPRWFQLGRERLKFTSLSRTQTRTCPICAREGTSGHLGLWQISSIRSCAKHNCLLVSLPAPVKDKDLFDWSRLREQQNLDHTIAVSGSSDLETYLTRRITSGPDDDWLGNMPFHVVAQTSENLGLLLTLGPDAKRAAVSEAQWREAGSAGYQVLRGGPDAFYAALLDLKNGYVNEAGRYRTRYRCFFDWLRYRDDDRDFDYIRDLVRNYVWRNFPVAKGALVLGKPCPEQHVHSLSTAATATGITRRQLGRRLCAMGLARPAKGHNGIELTDYIPANVVHRVRTEFSELFNATEAAAYLGLKRFMLTKLTRPDLIALYISDDKAYPLYQRTELDAFLARLERLRERNAPTEGWMEIASASHRLKITTEKAVTLILANMLPLRSVQKEGNGFRDYHISLTELRSALTLPEGGAVHPARAARLLGLTTETVLALISRGHLDKVVVRSSAAVRVQHYVCPIGIELFAQDYISLAEHCKATRLSAEWRAIRKLELSSLQLDLGAGAEPIYRREDLRLL